MSHQGINQRRAWSTAAVRIGVSLTTYMTMINLGKKRCWKCQEWHDKAVFGEVCFRGSQPQWDDDHDEGPAHCPGCGWPIRFGKISFSGGKTIKP